MQTIRYPVKGRRLEDVVDQHMLDMLMTHMENWQQGPGVFGRLSLHSCWSEASVLARRYQGETVITYVEQMRLFRRLYAHTGNPKWKLQLHAMAAHLLYLQDASGGFIHTTAEFEPTFDTRGCPIHYFSPVIALCEYYLWPEADETVKSFIPAAVDRQWEWSLKHSWGVGNGRWHPLHHPGWCGVTNQDLTAIGALVLTGKAFGKWDRFEQYGKPTLDYILSPACYYPAIGLFERGDGENYAERTVYYTHVLKMLRLIGSCVDDPRLEAAVDNVAGHLFDAVFVAEDGLTYLARGAKTDPEDKTKVLGWEYGAIAFSGYPSLIPYMQEWVDRHQAADRQPVVDALKETLAAYVFCDGTIPAGIFNPSPLFTIASGLNDQDGWYSLVMDMLGDDLRDPQTVKLPSVHRTLRDMTWKQNGRLWAVERDGQRLYGGYSRFPGNLAVGPEEKPIWGNFSDLEDCDVQEIVEA